MLKLSRIYRDARRLHGNGPYKDHLWFCVRAGGEDWTGRPTFYFEIGPDYYSYGMGFWAPKAALMEAYRKGIDENPETLAKLVRRFNRQTHFRPGRAGVCPDKAGRSANCCGPGIRRSR